MPGPNRDAGLDFAAALTAAQTPPAVNTEGRDLVDGYPLPVAATHRVVDSSQDPSSIQGVMAYDYNVYRKVFVIFRPYWECPRCRDELADHIVTLPAVGDYDCPHTNLKAYQESVDQALAGKIIIGPETEQTLKDGTMLVSLKWWVSKINHKRLRQMRREEARSRGEDLPPENDEEQKK